MGCAGRWLFAVADGLGGHTARNGITLTAMIFSGGRAALAHRLLPPRSGFAAAISASSPRTARSATSSPTLTRSRQRSHCTWTAGQTVRPIQACGPVTGDRYVLYFGGRRRPNALECTHFARRIRRRTDQPTALAGGPASVSRLTSYRCSRSGTLGQAGSRLHCTVRICARRSAAIPGDHEAPGINLGRLPARCAQANRRTILRERCAPPISGQTRAQQGPLDHPPRSPRGQGPATGTHHET